MEELACITRVFLLRTRCTGKGWSPPSGPEAYPRLKGLRPVSNHPIVDFSDKQLSEDVIALLMLAQSVHPIPHIVEFANWEFYLS